MASPPRPVGPVHLADRFAPLDTELIALLRGLGPDDWGRPTACALWTVKDIAAHLLDGNLRRLSFQRDGLTPEPDVPARFPVAWAGEAQSANWFDVGREYTKRWLHQQQIRDAVGAPGLSSREWMHPVLDLFLRALPHRYRDVAAEPGTELHIAVEGAAGGDWTLRREAGGWRLFSKGLRPADARERVTLEGDQPLGAGVLGALAVMA
jgi:hypothetical protein